MLQDCLLLYGPPSHPMAHGSAQEQDVRQEHGAYALWQARLYRILTFFEYLDRKMIFGQILLTLMRTTTVLFYVVSGWD